MLSEDEFRKLLRQFLRDEYEKTNPKPNGLAGHMGFYTQKEREFEKLMIERDEYKPPSKTATLPIKICKPSSN